MDYRPRPLDTTDVEIDAELEELVEILSRNTHEVWAQQRLQDGWTLGPRDDIRKTHPCLIPYDALSETEKNYDRNTSSQVVKFILKAGHKIRGPQRKTQAPMVVAGHLLANIRKNVKDAKALVKIWHIRDLEEWRLSSQPYVLLGESFLHLGQPLLAFDVLREGSEFWPQERQVEFLKALAACRMGLYQLSLEIIERLVSEKQIDEYIIGLRGKNYKELFVRGKKENKAQYLARALQSYQEAFALSQGKFSAINCATLALLAGQNEYAKQQARYVLTIISPEASDYWDIATLGEAELILGHKLQAIALYRKAVSCNRQNYGDLSTTLNNAKLIVRHQQDQETLQALKDIFLLPKTLLFTGHRPGRDGLGPLASSMLPTIEREIDAQLNKLGLLVTFSSAAAGADIIFLELAQKRGAITKIILPGPVEVFKKRSVNFGQPNGAEWSERFDKVMAQAHECIFLAQDDAQLQNTSYEYAAEVIVGLAKMETEYLDTELQALAVLNPQVPEESSGASRAFSLWRKLSIPTTLIDVSVLENVPFALRKTTPESVLNPSKVMGIFFADTVNYSKLKNELYPLFEKEFWGAAHRLLEELGNPVVVKNTWGDALHLVFPSLNDAGTYALRLGEIIRRTEWASLGLPPHLNLRMALHAGPVFESKNPITSTLTYVGTNVCRAARLEPMTPPGRVFASREFAALLYAQGEANFECRYVGQMAMAKNYGTFPTYLVEWKFL
ncbi:MAG: TRAFs-binding domain-containing protein [Bdellovibrionota bacterium]